MIKHAFIKPGYLDEEDEENNEDEEDNNNNQGSDTTDKWLTPAEFCLKSVGQCILCQKENLIRCAWCQNYFCIDHALINVHVCEIYKP